MRTMSEGLVKIEGEFGRLVVAIDDAEQLSITVQASYGAAALRIGDEESLEDEVAELHQMLGNWLAARRKNP